MISKQTPISVELLNSLPQSVQEVVNVVNRENVTSVFKNGLQQYCIDLRYHMILDQNMLQLLGQNPNVQGVASYNNPSNRSYLQIMVAV